MARDSYLENDVRPRDMDGLFDAAARLYERVLHRSYGTQLVGIAAPALGVQRGCLWVGRERILGQGLMLFDGLQDYRRWMRALVQGEPVRPRAGACTLELQDSGRASPQRLSEIGRYGWRVADRRAHPVPYRCDPRLFVTAARRRDVELLAASCNALATLPALLDSMGAAAGELRTVYPASVGGRLVHLELTAGHPEATDTDRALSRVQPTGWRVAG